MINRVDLESQKQKAIDTHSRQADMFARRYETDAQDPYGSCFTYSRKRLDALLERFLPARGDGRKLLDVGCGTGHHLATLRRRGFDASGVDASEDMLAHARKNNPGADVRHGDVDKLPYDAATFDFAVCIEVLRYLPDGPACVREMARVLKPGGVCLATALPLLNGNGYAWVNLLATTVPALGKLEPLKQYFTTEGQLRRDFRAAGFAEVEVHGVYSGPINWVERLAKRQLAPLLRAWEPLDARISDLPVARDFSNMFLVRAVR
jgi:ubiquinone/menaquinone biosynthesis C-methylase UbiE